MTETANINSDDAILVQQCQMGDSAATERLIRKYQNRIYNAILRICANPEDAAELTQDTFVKIIESLNSFKGESRFYTWAFRIAVNLTLNYCQRNSRFKNCSLDAESGRNDSQNQVMKDFLSDDGLPDPASIAQNKELCEAAIKALEKLDEPHRAVVVLRDIEGMNYAQIAEVLEIELGTVRSRLSRARGRLREILEADLP